MKIRRTATTVSRGLRDRIRSALTTERDETETTRGDRDPESTVSDSVGNLFHCSRCRVVYIATEKHSCSECDGDVEQVRSTLACHSP